MPDSVFRRSALVSGLISPHDLEEAVAAVRAEGDAGSIDDGRLAKHLIAAGRLNPWQVRQLHEGRTTFKLGPYWILDSLGKGRTGEVYKAEHSIMGRVVAIKVLPKKKRSSPQAIAHFISEIRNQAQLDHKHLVCAYDAGHDLNVHFLVMEYVPGTDLRRLVRQQGKLSMETAADFIAQAAEGLAYAHARGLTHRDVKPSNLLITEQRQVKLSDLGLAGLFNEAEPIGDQGGFTTGSTDFLAPELIASPDRPTPLSDIYALGCTLYYAVTGKVPFPGGTPHDKVQGHLKLLPRHPRLLNPTLSDVFVEIIADMMAKNPQQRVASADDAIARLTAAW